MDNQTDKWSNEHSLGHEIIDELQNLRLNYLHKLKRLSDLEEELLDQKKKSESFSQVVRILKAQYLKLKVAVYHMLKGSASKKTDTNTEKQQKFNYQSYQIQLPSSTAGNRKKIIHAIPAMTTGGSQQLVVDLIENLSENYEHRIIVSDLSGPLGYTGVTIDLFEYKDTQLTEKLKAFLQQQKPDLVHIHFWSPIENSLDWSWYDTVFSVSFELGLKVVQNCNNPTFPYFDSKILRNIYVSDYAKNTFGLNAPNNLYIYPGSNFDKFKRNDNYVPGEVIGMVYRLEKDKLDEFSIEPFIETVKLRPSTKALIVGGGTWFDLFNKRVAEEGLTANFEFTGYVSYDAPPSYYSRISVFIAPVHKESFGQVTPFAMNMGIPVTGYSVGALPEIFANDSLLATKGDYKQLGHITANLLNDKARMMDISLFNHQRAQQLFSLKTMIELYGKEYDSILK